MPLSPAPCEPWPFDPSCCDVPDGVKQSDIDRWRQVATSILFFLSGRRWGPSCPLTVRPCGRSCIEALLPLTPSGYRGPQTGGRVPYLHDGAWFNAVCGCTTDCSCTQLCSLRLVGPVHDVVEVLVDGVVLPPEAYRVDSANMLIRLDGECWDACQDLQAPPTEPGTAAVTYRVGLPLDAAAIAAVSELTCHLLKGCNGGSCGCGVSRQNVSRVQRQGVTLEMADIGLLYREGRTGLPVTDMWLAAVNPYGQHSPSTVRSVDHRRPRQQTWP